MREIKLPPFYVGQRVVAIKTHSMGVFKRDDMFTVNGSRRSKCCNEWEIDIGFTSTSQRLWCVPCNVSEISTGTWWMKAYLFAPIQETFQSISLEKVLENETELIGAN